MEPTLKNATDVLRLVAETHLMGEMRHLHSGGSPAMAVVIGFLLDAGEAEYHDLPDPCGSGQVIRREIRLKPST